MTKAANPASRTEPTDADLSEWPDALLIEIDEALSSDAWPS